MGSPQAGTSSVVAPVQLNQIAVVPPREECAKIGVNCAAQKCCKVTGYECYEVKPGMAKCMKECTPGKDGTCLHHTVPMKASKKSDISYSANTLFCWAFYTENTGSTKKSYELDLLRTQLFLGASIFGCESYRVYSDVETWLSPDKVSTVKVNDANGDFHFAKRKKTGSWINSNIFIAAWKAIKDEGVWASKDWTVKVDADAVFLPTRLRQYLGKVEVTENGIYLENCKYVSYGFFGSLEVLSHGAASTYMANLDDCKTSLNYLGREKLYGNEPWGEDLFAQRCMVLTRFLLSTSTLTRLAQHGGLRAKRRTRNGAPTAQQHRHPQFTISRHLRLILTALRRLNAEAVVMLVCNVLDR